jgi:two-component system OmpR family sensor kinase
MRRGSRRRDRSEEAEPRRRRGGRLRRLIGSRLFFKVYLTLLACLTAVAIASGAYWSAATNLDDIDWDERRDRLVEALLPTGDDPAIVDAMLTRFAAGVGADVALYTASGRPIAAAGNEPVPFPDADDLEDLDVHDLDIGRGLVTMRLADGRILTARMDLPFEERARGKGPIGYVLLIAAVIGAAAYPVVRNMTGRLERLRRGVDRFGGGDLVARVPVEGRDEIATVATAFNKTADRIERLVSAHRALLANASHELRSPVTRLRMAIDLYEKPQDGEARTEILQNLGEIDQLVDEILLASRLDHVQRLENPERLDLMALTAEECARHGIEASGAPAEIIGDARLLTRLLRNLILNALRHGKPPVEVEVQAAGKRVRLIVRDHGDGLPKGEEDRVFEPFYRPSGRSEAAGGWGLGLALVRQIAEHHGGTVRHETRDGGGACFVVEVPRVA